jgi:integrase
VIPTKRNKQPLTPDELARVLNTADGYLISDDQLKRRAGLLAWTLLTTGIRISEAQFLVLDHLDPQSRLLTVRRHKKRDGDQYQPGVPYSGYHVEEQVVPDALVNRIELAHPPPAEPDRHWFVGKGGNAVKERTLRNDWKVVLRAAGVPVRGSHCARRTYATLVGYYDSNVHSVNHALGHSPKSIETSAGYVGANLWRRMELVNKMFPDRPVGKVAIVDVA